MQALSTTRNGGVSIGARATLDVGGALLPQDANARRAREPAPPAQFLPAAPVWLAQVHGRDVAVDRRAQRSTALRASPPTRRRGGDAHAGRRARRAHRRLPAGAVRRSRGHASSASRMPAGAGSPPACSKRRCARCACRRATSSRGWVPRSARERSKWAATSSTRICGTDPGCAARCFASRLARTGQMARRPARPRAAAACGARA